MFDHCLYFNTTALARRLEREWSKAFRPFGLTPPQAFMLRAVLARPGLLQSELANLLSVSRPTITRAVDGLVARKLVLRSGLPHDSRLVALHPTPAAVALGPQLNEASGAVTRRLRRGLGNTRFDASVAQARELRAALK